MFIAVLRWKLLEMCLCFSCNPSPPPRFCLHFNVKMGMVPLLLFSAVISDRRQLLGLSRSRVGCDQSLVHPRV